MAQTWELAHPGERRKLYVIGGSALLIHFGGTTATKDLDFAVTQEEKEEFESELRPFMRGGEKVGPDGLYVEFVNDAFTPMPRLYRKRAIFERRLGPFDIYRLNPVDYILSKIGRFGSKDRSDIEAVLLNRAAELSAELLREVFEEQFYFAHDLADQRRPRLTRIIDYFEGRLDRL